jgi:HEAT repeat protein
LFPVAEAKAQSAPVRAQDFPRLANRSPHFEARVNAPDPEIRKRVLREVTFWHMAPDDETETLLRLLLEDDDPGVRGLALRTLYDRWRPVAVAELPTTFSGYHDGQRIDLEDPTCVPALIEQCQTAGAAAGYAAYALGLLRAEEAVPALRALAQHDNVFVRYSAGRALLDCGATEAGAEILDAISREQLQVYANPPDPARDPRESSPVVPRDGRRQPFYAYSSTRALLGVSPEWRDVAQARLIELLAHLERSSDPNDQQHRFWLRQILADALGRYCATADEARAAARIR